MTLVRVLYLAVLWLGQISLVDAEDVTGRALAATCTGCHGTAGVSQGGIPSLAGLSREDIARMMREAFVEDAITIEPGDRLLLFTDGASEAKNSAGEEFGESRLESRLASAELTTAQRLQSAIAAAVTAFAAGDLEDDLTIVTLTRPA